MWSTSLPIFIGMIYLNDVILKDVNLIGIYVFPSDACLPLDSTKKK